MSRRGADPAGNPADWNPEVRERGLDAWLRFAYRLAYRLQLALWRVRRPTIHGAHVAVWHAGRVLVIQNSYRRSYSFPAGRIKRREAPAVAAARELAEEVGISVHADALRDAGELIDVTAYAEDRVRMFELHCRDQPSIHVDGREVVVARFLEPEQALALDLVAVSRRYLEELDAPEASGRGESAGGRNSDAPVL